MSWKILSSLRFIFYFCLQTKEHCYRLLRLTNQSSVIQPVSGTKLNMLYPTPVFSTRKIWHQKSMTDWPVSGTRWLVPETGAWNWPVCHHYNKLPERGLRRSPSLNRIWCITCLKYEMWWQQLFNQFRENQLTKLAHLLQFKRVLLSCLKNFWGEG